MSNDQSQRETVGNGDRNRGLFRNTVSLIGTALALVSLANVVFLFLIDVVSGQPSPYIGVFAYMIMPAFLVLGLILIPIGMLLERERRRKMLPGEVPRFPRIDLNNPAQRSTVAFFLGFVIVFVLLSAVGSYRAYEFTDSVEFCGQLCHSVMNPEFVAYSQSPHARVRCVDCHVGAGATWYARSKLSGARQVYATMFNKYPRPIPTPVESLRPAPETCEQCHWPKKFHGAQLKVFTHYGNDEKNTPRQIKMLIKTGGGDPSSGVVAGIHWHMNIANEITYLSTDARRQVIPWVRMKDMNGNVTEYVSKDAPATKEQMDNGHKRRMDCVDCHNRPTHIYPPPDRSVDDSLLARRIDVSLPFIKQQAVTALTGEYKTQDEGLQGIARSLQNFYSEKYPQLAKAHPEQVQRAIGEVQRIFKGTMFPEMRTDWRTHLNNIGHFYYPGCFRCHDGGHVSKEGKTIRKDCDICHTLLAQEEGGQPMAVMQSNAFKHPVDLGDMTAVNCNDCHTGGIGP
jgi:nitrate/TMAO reductase-like tetraheme cytochrome c subunit